MADDKADDKYFEAVLKHYSELFIYHASQRLTTFRYFVAAFSVSAAAFATMISRGENAQRGAVDIHFLGAILLAGSMFVISLCFARLDKRNEQIIWLNEETVKALQKIIKSKLDAGSTANPASLWEPFARSDDCARALTTFGSVLPIVFFLTSILSLSGLLGILYYICLYKYSFGVILIVAAILLAAAGWAAFSKAAR